MPGFRTIECRLALINEADNASPGRRRHRARGLKQLFAGAIQRRAIN